MNLKFVVITACLFLLLSCNYLKKDRSIPTITIDTIINFNSIDAYPLFSECADIPSREKQKICFQIKLSEHVNTLLNNIDFTSTKDINDTILVDLLIKKNGKTAVLKIKESALISKTFPKLDSLIRISISKLPRLEPAIKRGIPVSTKFTLPIIIKNN